jgi:transcription-repair coupling factor (superfamily II helicase)
MRDLEIRGAGNLLGAEQSGFIDEIGFELYQRIVDEAVDELKREEFKDLFREKLQQEEERVELPMNEDITVEVTGDALIPKDYISDDSERYDFYLRMYSATNLEELNGLVSEMRDRFGPVPEATVNLLRAVRLRLASMPTGAPRLAMSNSTLRLDLPAERNQAYYDRWFQPIMYAINEMRSVARLETKGKSLAVVFTGVNTVEDAERLLTEYCHYMETGAREGVDLA